MRIFWFCLVTAILFPFTLAAFFGVKWSTLSDYELWPYLLGCTLFAMFVAVFGYFIARATVAGALRQVIPTGIFSALLIAGMFLLSAALFRSSFAEAVRAAWIMGICTGVSAGLSALAVELIGRALEYFPRPQAKLSP